MSAWCLITKGCQAGGNCQALNSIFLYKKAFVIGQVKCFGYRLRDILCFLSIWKHFLCSKSGSLQRRIGDCRIIQAANLGDNILIKTMTPQLSPPNRQWYVGGCPGVFCHLISAKLLWISAAPNCMKTWLFIPVSSFDVKQFLLLAKGHAEGIFSFVRGEVKAQAFHIFLLPGVWAPQFEELWFL